MIFVMEEEQEENIRRISGCDRAQGNYHPRYRRSLYFMEPALVDILKERIDRTWNHESDGPAGSYFHRV